MKDPGTRTSERSVRLGAFPQQRAALLQVDPSSGFIAFHQHPAPLCAQEEGFGAAQTVAAAKKYLLGNQARTNTKANMEQRERYIFASAKAYTLTLERVLFSALCLKSISGIVTSPV